MGGHLHPRAWIWWDGIKTRHNPKLILKMLASISEVCKVKKILFIDPEGLFLTAEKGKNSLFPLFTGLHVYRYTNTKKILLQKKDMQTIITDFTNSHIYFEMINEVHQSSTENLPPGTELILPKQNKIDNTIIFKSIC